MDTSTLEALVAHADRVTAEQLHELSNDPDHRYELVKGKLIMMSPAGGEHGKLALRLGARLQVFVEQNSLGETFAAETGFRLAHNPDTVLAPDVSFVSEERMGDQPVSRSFMPIVPDLVVEVVSLSETASQVQAKVQEWLRHGTKLLWLVEPETQTVTVYRQDGTASLLHRDDTLDGEDVLPGFAYRLEKLFG